MLTRIAYLLRELALLLIATKSRFGHVLDPVRILATAFREENQNIREIF